MKLSVEQLPGEAEEEVIVRCYDAQEKWVEAIRSITAGEISITGCVDEKTYRLKLSDVYYFEVLEGRSFLYCEKTVLECQQKLYEFEALCEGSMFFRYSKSMILHWALLEAILLPLAHYWEFWHGALDAVIYGVFILVAKMLWHFVDFGQSIRTATEVNDQLRKRRMNKKDDMGGTENVKN